MDLEEALEEMRRHGDELKLHAPGRVVVDRIHQIDAVNALRACKATITQSEMTEIRHAMAELKSHLVGLEVAVAPPKPRFRHRFARMKEAREHEVWQQMSTTAGGRAKLPPPLPLIDAAQAWLIAQITADRTDVDTTAICEPWLQAHVVPD